MVYTVVVFTFSLVKYNSGSAITCGLGLGISDNRITRSFSARNKFGNSKTAFTGVGFLSSDTLTRVRGGGM